MTGKVMGAVMIVAACGGFGFSAAASHIREEQCMKRLIHGLEIMKCELSYRLTPLPELCHIVGKASGGLIGSLFIRLAGELESQISPDVDNCLSAALSKSRPLPKSAEAAIRILGSTLGRFDMEGQLLGLESVMNDCKKELERLEKDREQRLRNYQTLGLCAGAAMAILFV